MPLATTNGVTLAYETFGAPERPTILLIMGYAAQLTRWPVELCDELVRRGFHVVRFDNRDVGLSGKIAAAGVPDIAAIIAGSATLPYTLEDMALDAVGLLDVLSVRRAHIVGASMGGMIAQIFAADHPDRTLSLTSIMSSSGDPDLPRAKDEIMMALMETPPPDDPEAVIARGVRLAVMVGSPGFPEGEEVVRARVRRDFERCYDPDGVQRQLAAVLVNGDRSERLKRITAPTIVLHGQDDPLVPVEAGRDTAAKVAGAELREVPGMGHDFPVALVPIFADAICASASRAAIEIA
jgi:pimeloyl-ACP methyl ester carboxylesterase